MLLDGAHEGFQFQGRQACLGLHNLLDPNLIIRFSLKVLLHPGLDQALDENLHPSVRKLEHPHDHGNGANAIDILGLGVLHIQRPLGSEQDHPVSCQGLVDGLDGHLSPHEKGQDHIREDHDISYR